MRDTRPRSRVPLALLGLLVLGCGPRTLDAVPEALLGAWRTRAERYENRVLEISATRFVLGVGKLDLDTQPIHRVDVRRDRDGNAVYRLHYTADEGYDDTLVLTYMDTATPALRVGAIPHLWTRVDDR